MPNYRFKTQTLEVPFDRAFDYIVDPQNLPEFTHAFATVSADGSRATMRTPKGEVEVVLEVQASREHGTIDWIMTFPDGALATAYSRLIALGDEVTQYGFVLTPPPGPLEELEGTLDEQGKILEQELAELKAILEDGGKREPRVS